MKKIFYFAFLSFFFSASTRAQTVTVSGACITGTVTLDPIGDIDGRPAYESAGTVDGFPDVQIDVYWLPAPDNLWVLAFDGQPYFQNSCDVAMPPSTNSSTCPWTAVSGQTCTGTDPLTVMGTGTLAVKITGFTAQKNSQEVVLKWQTASEINNKGFEIQRSLDGISWNKIGFVADTINSSVERNYQFTDFRPLPGKNYYRLVQYDLDNKATYSLVVTVKFLQSSFYSLLNNPGKGLFKLNIEPTSERINLTVIDQGGRRIMNQGYIGAGLHTIDITNYPAGIYLLRIQKGTNLFTERLIKL
jgi:hypothetical protein